MNGRLPQPKQLKIKSIKITGLKSKLIYFSNEISTVDYFLACPFYVTVYISLLNAHSV